MCNQLEKFLLTHIDNLINTRKLSQRDISVEDVFKTQTRSHVNIADSDKNLSDGRKWGGRDILNR